MKVISRGNTCFDLGISACKCSIIRNFTLLHIKLNKSFKTVKKNPQPKTTDWTRFCFQKVRKKWCQQGTRRTVHRNIEERGVGEKCGPDPSPSSILLPFCSWAVTPPGQQCFAELLLL